MRNTLHTLHTALRRWWRNRHPRHEGATTAYATELHHLADDDTVDEFTTDVELYLRDHAELERIGDQVLAAFNTAVDTAVDAFLRRGGLDPQATAASYELGVDPLDVAEHDGWAGVRELAGVN